MTSDDLRTWMTAHRYSIRELARDLDIAPSTVQRYRDDTLPIPRIVTLALDALSRAPIG